jgi:hypothetical protein
MHVDDVVEAIFRRLCIRQQDALPEADRSMSLVELQLALGVTEALLNEALWLLTFPGDKRIIYAVPGHVALGPDWRERCERQEAPPAWAGSTGRQARRLDSPDGDGAPS